MRTVLLMNPNSNPDTTTIMCETAGAVLGYPPIGWTAPSGPSIITTPEALAHAASLVEAVEPGPEISAVIVAAFGDPGARGLQDRLSCPVIGIGAASARAASTGGSRFAVATTTPDLKPPIDALMKAEGLAGSYLGCFLTEGDPLTLMEDARALDRALLAAVSRAEAAGAEHVIIGGGPLGAAAERLRSCTNVPLFNPVICAAREVAALWKCGS